MRELEMGVSAGELDRRLVERAPAPGRRDALHEVLERGVQVLAARVAQRAAAAGELQERRQLVLDR
jgi:hypothetical protein